MTAFYETVFILQFVAFVIVFFYKMYNIFKIGTAYEQVVAWMTFISGILIYGVGFILVMVHNTDLYIIQLLKFESILISVFGLFFVIEIILYLRTLSTSFTNSRNALEAYNGNTNK